jgi:hypothetical protein
VGVTVVVKGASRNRSGTSSVAPARGPRQGRLAPESGVVFNQPMPALATSDYRLSPALGARLMGLLLVLLAVVLFAATAVVALLRLTPDLLILVALLGLAGVFTAGWALTRRSYVVRLGEQGYRVRLIRGAGVKAARWKDVEDAVTTTRHDLAVVVLRLRDGRTTTIPVAALAADREAFVRDLQQHLQHGQGRRPL